MAEITLEFIAQRLDHIQTELRSLRNDLHILDGHLHIVRGDVARISDTLSMDLLDRIRKLEERQPS